MTLSTLIAKVEALTGPSREVDARVCIAIQYGGVNSEGATNVRTDEDWDGDLLFEIGAVECCNPIPPLSASIDAVVALIERELPGAEFDLTNLYGVASATLPLNGGDQSYETGRNECGILACALLAAFLRALEARAG